MKLNHRFLVYVVVMSIVFLPLLTSCQQPQATMVATSPVAIETEHQIKELILWTFLDPLADDPRGKALKQVVDSFNASHPEIKVSVENIHWEKIDSQVIQAESAGAGPDLINIYSVQLPQHVAAGSVQPITKYVNQWLTEEGKDYSFPLEGVTFDKEIMALPWEMRVWLLYYRKDLLEQAGLPIPITLDELAETAGQIRKNSNGKIAGFQMGFSEAELAADFIEKFEPLLWGAGGQLIDENGKASFAGPEGVKVIQWMYDLVNKQETMGRDALTATSDVVLSGVKAGTIAMMMEGSMRVSAAREAEEVGEYIFTTPIPGWDSEKPLPALVAGQTLAIGKNTKNPDAAWEFIKFYLVKESQLAFAAAGVMPVNAAVLQDPQLANTSQGLEIKSWMEHAKNYGRMGRYPDDFPKLCDILVKAAQKIIFSEAPLKETLEQAANEYNALHP